MNIWKQFFCNGIFHSKKKDYNEEKVLSSTFILSRRSIIQQHFYAFILIMMNAIIMNTAKIFQSLPPNDLAVVQKRSYP